MSQIELSIIIVTWNTAPITLECLKTIHQYLSDKLSFEVIVVDNASTDNTILEIKNWSASRRIKIINNPQNYGFARACNIGARKAKGIYLLFLNSDMKLIDSSLVKMVEYIKNHSRIGIIGPKFLNPDLTPQGSVFPPQTAINAFKEYILGIKNAYSKYVPTTNQPIPVWSISGGALIIKKELFFQAKGWNEKYFMYFEDLDLCQTIRQLGYLVIFYPRCSLIHAHGQSGKNLTPAKDQWRRLIPSSIKFHGKINHYLINIIIWLGQKIHHLSFLSYYQL
ncbi:MAG TPA: glycosyltransferase family 2 protein [Candidatus Woesebacteria bacterium]|nr:glycosyltransferase family 2 protein [Candidatus Woesebacteria bacterium]HRT39945.1 glycosyltransferase family 2 protein [Candidatus Woesebacteria bacterium]